MAQANHTRTEKNNQQFPPIISRKTLDSSRYGGGIIAGRRKTMAKRMNPAQLATEACDQGFQEGVRKMVEILLQGSTTPTEHKQAMQRGFEKGLGSIKRRTLMPNRR
jgi:hypothetical protein